VAIGTPSYPVVSSLTPSGLTIVLFDSGLNFCHPYTASLSHESPPVSSDVTV